MYLFTYLYVWCFISYLVPYQLDCDGLLEGQRKPVHRVGHGSVLYTADQRQAPY